MKKEYKQELLSIMNKHFDFEYENYSKQINKPFSGACYLKACHIKYNKKKLLLNWNLMRNEIMKSDCIKSTKLKHLMEDSMSINQYTSDAEFNVGMLSSLLMLVVGQRESFSHDIKNIGYTLEDARIELGLED